MLLRRRWTANFALAPIKGVTSAGQKIIRVTPKSGKSFLRRIKKGKEVVLSGSKRKKAIKQFYRTKTDAAGQDMIETARESMMPRSKLPLVNAGGKTRSPLNRMPGMSAADIEYDALARRQPQVWRERFYKKNSAKGALMSDELESLAMPRSGGRNLYRQQRNARRANKNGGSRPTMKMSQLRRWTKRDLN